MQREPLLDLLYEAAVDGKAWGRFATALEEAAGGVRVMISLPHPGADTGSLIAPSLDPVFVGSYQSLFYGEEPWREQLDGLPVGSVAWVEDLAREIDVPASRFFRDWMEPQALCARPVLVSVVDRDPARRSVELTVYRPRGVQSLGAARALCERLAPHVQRAARIHLRKAVLEEEHAAFLTALDRLSAGLVLLDRAGRPRATNRAAERILAERDGLALARDGLIAATPEDTLRLRELAGRPVASEPRDEVRALLLARPSGRRPLQVVRCSLADEQRETPGAVAALFLWDPESRAAPSATLLQRMFRLTPSEAALCAELAAGRSVTEAARSLGVTPGTARQRLNHVFQKTGTHRQAALVRLLLTTVALVDP